MPIESFKAQEYKSFVVLDGRSQRGAGLRAREGGLSRIEIIAGLQILLPQKSEELSVNHIGSRARNYIHGAARRAAVLGRKTAAVDLKLLDSLLAYRHSHSAGVRIVLDAVNEEGVGTAIAAPEAETRLRSLRNPVIVAVH